MGNWAEAPAELVQRLQALDHLAAGQFDAVIPAQTVQFADLFRVSLV